MDKNDIILARHAEPFINPDFSFKIVIVGDTGVGKTCLLKRYESDEFDESYSVTIGGDFINVNYLVNSTYQVKVQIWDTCGLEQYRSLVRLYFKGSNAALLTYDIAQKSTKPIRIWYEELHENMQEDIPIFLVGTKSDTVTSKDKKKDDEIQILLKQYGFSNHFITSSKTKEGIIQAFENIVKDLYKKAIKEELIKKQKDDKLRKLAATVKFGKKNSCC